MSEAAAHTLRSRRRATKSRRAWRPDEDYKRKGNAISRKASQSTSRSVQGSAARAQPSPPRLALLAPLVNTPARTAAAAAGAHHHATSHLQHTASARHVAACGRPPAAPRPADPGFEYWCGRARLSKTPTPTVVCAFCVVFVCLFVCFERRWGVLKRRVVMGAAVAAAGGMQAEMQAGTRTGLHAAGEQQGRRGRGGRAEAIRRRARSVSSTEGGGSVAAAHCWRRPCRS